MNEWHGIRDDVTTVSDVGMQEAQNCSFRTQGELRRRPGLGTRLNLSGVLSREFVDRSTNVYEVFITSLGAIKSIALSDSTITTLKSSLSTAYRGQFALSNQRLYYTDDFDRMQVVELGNSAALDAGIAAPTTGSGTATLGAPTTGAGLVDIGTRNARYRYYNSRSGYYSNPSLLRAITLTGAAGLTFSIGTGAENIFRSADPKVDQVVVEFTLAGASAYYKVAAVNQALTSVTISMSDTSIALQDLAAAYGDFGQEQPPLFALVTEHRGRLFGWGSTVRTLTGVTLTLSGTTVTVTGSTFSPQWAGRIVQQTTGTVPYRISSVTNSGSLELSSAFSGATTTSGSVRVYSVGSDILFWSRAGYPEAWKPTDWARRVLQNASDVPSGMVSFHDVLWLFGQLTMRVLDYPSDPATGTLEQVPSEMGLFNQRCIVQSGGYIFGWGRSGVWMLNGLTPKHISRPIDPRLDGTDTTSTVAFDASLFEKFFGYYDAKERCLTWVYCKTGDTVPKNHISYDLDRKEWRTGSWRQGMLTSTLTAGTANDVRVMLSDENGYSWYLTEGRFDGVPLAMVNSVSDYSGVVSVSTTGATTSIIPVDQALPTGTTDLAGVVLYHPTTSGTAVVASNTANQITLATALTGAPTAGAELYLGSFEWKMRLKWVDSLGLETKKRPAYVMVKKVPGSTVGSVRVRIYEDFSTTPFVFTRGANDTLPDQVSFTDGAQYADVALDDGTGNGVAFVPLGANWKRSLTAEVTNTKPTNTLKMLEVRFMSQSQRSEVEDIG